MSPNPAIKHILVCHDLGECSNRALEYAVWLAPLHLARITVLHVCDIPSMGAPEVVVLTTDWVEQIAGKALEALNKTVAGVGAGEILIDQQVRTGSAWREITVFAEKQKVDLVVVGSHGRRGVPRALLGSVAEKVARTAPCPVLIVRGTESAR